MYLPEFSGSSLWINIPYVSSSPEEIERLITIPVEDAVSTIEHLETISSSSSSNNASISMGFELGTNMRIAATQVTNRIDEIKASLPDEIDRIKIQRFRSGDLPVVEFQIAGIIEKEKLFHIVEKVIKRRFQRIDGVASVEIKGIDNKQVFVDLDNEKLKTHNVDVYSLRNMVVASNVDLSAGTIIDGKRKYRVHTKGNFKSIKDIKGLPVPVTIFSETENKISSDKQLTFQTSMETDISMSKNITQSSVQEKEPDTPQPQIIRLNDLSDIRYDFPKKVRFRRLHGKDAVTISVLKTSYANTITVVKGVKKALKELMSDNRLTGLEINVYRDRSKPVVDSLAKLRNAGIIGGLLVGIVLFFFLGNVRSTIIVVVAIPISILSAFTLMFLLRRFFHSEITINVISLSGMMLAVGFLVDPAIVVLENIFRHRIQKDLSAKEAAISGTSEVGLAIVAATATTISVFTPLIFLSKNRMGIFLHDFGVTVCITVVASLIIAITLIPLVSSRLLTKINKKKAHSFTPHYNNKKPHWSITYYLNFINFTIKHKWGTIGVATLIVLISFYLFKNLEQKIIWSTPYRETRIWIDTPKDYDIKDTEQLFKKLEELIQQKKQELEITTISSNFEKDGGILEAYLKPKENATLSIETVRERLRNLLPAIPGVKYSGARRYGYGPVSDSMSIELHGRNIDTLIRLADRTKRKLEILPYISEVDTNLQSGTSEIEVNIKREKARKVGLSPHTVAFGLKGALSSRAISALKSDDSEVDISFQITEKDRDTLEKLKNITFNSKNNDNVTIDQIALLKYNKGPTTIERLDRKPTITLNMNYKNAGFIKIRKDIAMIMNKIKLPPNYIWEMGGQYKHYRKEAKELYFGLLLAIIIIYMIMASLFESFVYPFTIMLSIPFAFTGVAITFYLIKIPLDDFAQIGMMLLSGIVVNNAIVLIDYINKLRKSGMEKKDAILYGVKDRFRPILMTSITTILGLLPMVLPLLIPKLFGELEGRERMWAPLGLVIVAGLTTSTILTLVILPTFYSLIDDLATFGKRFIKTL